MADLQRLIIYEYRIIIFEFPLIKGLYFCISDLCMKQKTPKLQRLIDNLSEAFRPWPSRSQGVNRRDGVWRPLDNSCAGAKARRWEETHATGEPLPAAPGGHESCRAKWGFSKTSELSQNGHEFREGREHRRHTVVDEGRLSSEGLLLALNCPRLCFLSWSYLKAEWAIPMLRKSCHLVLGNLWICFCLSWGMSFWVHLGVLLDLGPHAACPTLAVGPRI